jgi:hypothetical protein
MPKNVKKLPKISKSEKVQNAHKNSHRISLLHQKIAFYALFALHLHRTTIPVHHQ